jgi:alanyl-tRNA synthetase
MATRRLYYDDSYMRSFSAHVLGCVPAEPVSTPSGPQAAWEVVLDQTALYPTSGGQPNDLGCLGDAKVLDVRDTDDVILHIVDREMELGEVQGSIDWARRFDHMQQHTGQHLLSAMFQERYGLPTVSFHLGSDLCTIDLRGPEPILDVLEGAQRAANQVVFEDRPVTVKYGTPDQLAQVGVRKEVDRQGILRAIEIDAADLQPCGGTHVKSTGQIGLVLVRRCSKIRQDWRVEFACGARAERLASGDFQMLREVSDRLSCSPDDAPAAIEKLMAERDAHFKSLRSTLEQLAGVLSKAMVSEASLARNGLWIVAQLLREVHPELLLPLATELAKHEKAVALLVHEETGQIVFAQHASAGTDLAAILKRVLAVTPGKGGGSRDFVRARLADPARSAEALELAKKLLAG